MNELNPPAIVQPAQDLATLAAEINRNHEAGEAAVRKGLEHFRAAGEALLKVRGLCKHGEWLLWLKENVHFSQPTAHKYMQIAARWDELFTVNNLTLTEAYQHLVEIDRQARLRSNAVKDYFEPSAVDECDEIEDDSDDHTYDEERTEEEPATDEQENTDEQVEGEGEHAAPLRIVDYRQPDPVSDEANEAGCVMSPEDEAIRRKHNEMHARKEIRQIAGKIRRFISPDLVGKVSGPLENTYDRIAHIAHHKYLLDDYAKRDIEGALSLLENRCVKLRQLFSGQSSP